MDQITNTEDCPRCVDKYNKVNTIVVTSGITYVGALIKIHKCNYCGYQMSFGDWLKTSKK